MRLVEKVKSKLPNDDNGINEEVPKVTESLKQYVQLLTPNKGKRSQLNQNKIDTIVAGCTHDGTNNIKSICNYFNINVRSYENEMQREKKKRKDCTSEIARACIDPFVHSEVFLNVARSSTK